MRGQWVLEIFKAMVKEGRGGVGHVSDASCGVRLADNAEQYKAVGWFRSAQKINGYNKAPTYFAKSWNALMGSTMMS